MPVQIAVYLTAAVLLTFTLRRAALLMTAVVGRVAAAKYRGDGARAVPRPPSPVPFVHVLVPVRNEAPSLPSLFEALERLDYPPEQLRLTLVDDGSTDNSEGLARSWAANRPWIDVLSLPRNVGKAQALNAVATSAEIVVVYDADHRPAADALWRLMAPLADERVGAVCGQMLVANGAASPAAFYAHAESLVNQLVTMRAKDRLNLAPALLGSNCAYRVAALQSTGGFRAGALLEDSDLTLALALAGWRTRFAAGAISEHRAPETVRGYIQQHLRWNRGFHQVTAGRLPSLWRSQRLSPLLKLELTFFALGYADRLALVAGALLTMLGWVWPGAVRFPSTVWVAYFGLPALELIAALRLAREPWPMYARLAFVPFFFALDVGIALWSTLQSTLGRPIVWRRAERSATGER